MDSTKLFTLTIPTNGATPDVKIEQGMYDGLPSGIANGTQIVSNAVGRIMRTVSRQLNNQLIEGLYISGREFADELVPVSDMDEALVLTYENDEGGDPVLGMSVGRAFENPATLRVLRTAASVTESVGHNLIIASIMAEYDEDVFSNDDEYDEDDD